MFTITRKSLSHLPNLVSEFGCEALLTRGIAREHEDKCGYQRVTCPYGPDLCDKVLKIELDAHVLDCPHRHVPCSRGCGVTLPRSAMEVSTALKDLHQL